MTDHPRPLCCSPGCSDPQRYPSTGLCNRCHQRHLRRGRSGARPRGTGPEAHAWRGDRVRYNTAHSRVVARWGPAHGFTCALCTAGAQEWALVPQAAATVCPSTGLRFSADPDDYAPLCRSCHRRTDALAAAYREALAAPADAMLPGLSWSGLLCPPHVPRRRVRRTARAVVAPLPGVDWATLTMGPGLAGTTAPMVQEVAA